VILILIRLSLWGVATSAKLSDTFNAVVGLDKLCQQDFEQNR